MKLGEADVLGAWNSFIWLDEALQGWRITHNYPNTGVA
jgi:hypothetical protein